MCKKDESISFGLGILAGVVGGIVTGLLLAPKSGEETRKELKETICNFAEEQAPSVQKAKQQALESVDLIKYKIERQFKKLNYMIKSKKLQKAKELEGSDYDFN